MERPFPMGISVLGEGSLDARPDTAYVTLGINARGTSLTEAQHEAGRSMASVIVRLRAMGVGEADTQPLGIGGWQDEMEGGSFVVSNFMVSNQVRVRIRDVDAVADLLNAAADAGANNIQGVVYVVEDHRAIERRAREEAMRDAAEKAAELARLGGLTLGAPLSISEAARDWRESPAIATGSPFGGPPFAEPFEYTMEPGWSRIKVRLRMLYSVE